MGQVIVGVDGSRAAWHAVEFAAGEARMRDATLHVVHVRAVPAVRGALLHSPASAFASAQAYEALTTQDRERQEAAVEHARQQGQQVLDDMLDGVDVDGLDVERTLLFDHRPARRLIDLARAEEDVELLVVGSRGHGELTGMLLGSVSQACVTHAQVPVTVVHGAAK